MPTGHAVRILANPHRVMRFFSGTTWFPGRRSGRIQSPGPVLKLSIAQWLMVLQKPLGCVSFSLSFMHLLGTLRWSTATTSAPSTCPPTRFSINAPSTLRSIFTSCGSVLLLVMSASCMFRHRLSTPTSSPRDFCHRCSRSSGPV